MLALTAVSLLSGCTPEHHRWQTVVNEDGSLVRTISRPISGTPDKIETAENWETRRFHKDMDRSIWPERITRQRIDSAKPEYEKGLDYFVARGEFESLDKVPQHYRFQLDESELISELKHELIVNDYGLVKEYVWSEEITDVVRPEDIPAARRELIELLATVVREGLQNGLGNDYDTSRLIRWIENEGQQLVEEFTLLLHSREFRQLDEDSRQDRFNEIAAKYGITELSDEGLQRFARKRLEAGVKRKDGKPLPPEIIDALVPDPVKEEENTEDRPNQYQEALQDAWKKHVGDDKEKPNRVQILLARQVGVHGVPLAGPPQEFDVWLKLPGEILETNGVVDEEGFLKWSFDKDDIWPSGYRMTARSVFPVRIRNSQVLRKEKLGLQDEVLAFLKLVKSDEELNETVQLCLAQNTLSPLETLEKLRRNDAGNPPVDVLVTTDEQAKWKRSRQLLDLLNQDPPAAAAN